MENVMGLLRIHIQKGVNLAVRDMRSSDPYVVVNMGKQILTLTSFKLRNWDSNLSAESGAFYSSQLNFIHKLKTRVVKKNVNPEWNEKVTLSVADAIFPIRLSVYDKDTFSFDDKMGDAEFEIGTFIKVLRMGLEGLPDGTIITKVQPSRKNCLAEESYIVWSKGKVVQNMVLRLRNVECGEVELQLQWINVPSSRGL